MVYQLEVVTAIRSSVLHGVANYGVLLTVRIVRKLLLDGRGSSYRKKILKSNANHAMGHRGTGKILRLCLEICRTYEARIELV